MSAVGDTAKRNSDQSGLDCFLHEVHEKSWNTEDSQNRWTLRAVFAFLFHCRSFILSRGYSFCSPQNLIRLFAMFQGLLYEQRRCFWS